MSYICVLPGQRCQVPPDLGGVKDPPSSPILQDQESVGSNMEVVSICSLFQMCKDMFICIAIVWLFGHYEFLSG